MAPDLSTELRALVDEGDAHAGLRDARGGGDPRRAAADDGDVRDVRDVHDVGRIGQTAHARSPAAVRTTMPSATGTRHARRCGTPSIVTWHSWQTPMPQSGPRASPRTDRRNAWTPMPNSMAATV